MYVVYVYNCGLPSTMSEKETWKVEQSSTDRKMNPPRILCAKPNNPGEKQELAAEIMRNITWVYMHLNGE